MNQYFNVKFSLFLIEVSFDTLEGNQLSYIQTGYFVKKIGVFMNHIINLSFRWKNKFFSELFTTQKIEKKYMTFLTAQSLLGILIFRYTNRTKIETDMVFIPGTHPQTSSNWSKKTSRTSRNKCHEKVQINSERQFTS